MSARMSIRPIMIALAIVSLLFTLYPGTWQNASAAASKDQPAFKNSALELSVGVTYRLEVVNKPSGAKYQWSSSDKSVATVDANGLVKAVAEGSATITSKITKGKKAIATLTAKIEVQPARVPVDENGLDAQGRMVAYFGSPAIDGNLDPVWSQAQTVTPKVVTGGIDTTATFKALWDDRALYILAEVKDKYLSVASGTPYMQDSFEAFLDENHDRTQEYGVDDLHIRVNYENALSVDTGTADRIYSSARKTAGGYVIETRIALKAQPENGKVMGIELQINDAKGTERVGTLNVFDATGNAWNDTSKFGEVLLAGKAKGAKSGLNPYDLLNLIESTLQLDFKMYKNPNVVTGAIKDIVAANIFNDKSATQDMIDSQYAALKTAVGKLVLTDEAANEKYFTPVPDDYRTESDKPGTIETLTYRAANLDGGLDDKKLHVYLPYGYDAADTTKKYNVLYLMHGGGENEDLIFGGPGQSKEMKKIIDNMIAKGDIEPMIVVTPTFNGGKNDTALFHEELIQNVVPLVETKYHTYAASGSLADLKASRAHRAFGGFSMGGVTTWYQFIYNLDYFKYFLPLSGDSWVVEQTGGGTKPLETAEYIANAAKKAGYQPQDYYVFSATGDLDIAYPNLKPQIDAMKQLKDSFIYSSDPSKGNLYFIVAKGGTHAWNWVNQYIYDILPDLFQN